MNEKLYLQDYFSLIFTLIDFYYIVQVCLDL